MTTVCLLAIAQHCGRSAAVDDRLVVARREAGEPAEFGLHLHLDRAVGGNLRSHVQRDAGFLERGRADLTALLGLRQLLIGDFRDTLENRFFVFEHGDIGIGQQPGVVRLLQARGSPP